MTQSNQRQSNASQAPFLALCFLLQQIPKEMRKAKPVKILVLYDVIGHSRTQDLHRLSQTRPFTKSGSQMKDLPLLCHVYAHTGYGTESFFA